jgi:hypothetical protein
MDLTYRGRTQPISAWARERGLRADTIRYRLRHGEPPERALRSVGTGRKHQLPRYVYRVINPNLKTPRYSARVRINGAQVYLGSFKTPEEASEVAMRVQKP